MDMDSVSGDEREIRSARNQALFRAVNENITALDRISISGSDPFVIACECADASCVAALSIDRDAYQSVRANPRQFALLPGHADPKLETVVTETGQYVVAEKFGDAALVVEQLSDLRG